MLSKNIQKALNEQIAMEGAASQKYLAMACWCDDAALSGCAEFLYAHSEEERMHMLKLVRYMSESGAKPITPAIAQPQLVYNNILDLFETAYQNELKVSRAINDLVELCVQEKDKQTENFLQWYVTEQHEEETLYRGLIDRIKLIGTEGRGLYFIDKEVEAIWQEKEKAEADTAA